MKSLLRFALMIALVIVGKLNTTSADSAKSDQTNEPLWIIPVHTATMHKATAEAASETGKFRSWHLLRDASADSE